jgi:hypothetical protein
MTAPISLKAERTLHDSLDGKPCAHGDRRLTQEHQRQLERKAELLKETNGAQVAPDAQDRRGHTGSSGHLWQRLAESGGRRLPEPADPVGRKVELLRACHPPQGAALQAIISK